MDGETGFNQENERDYNFRKQYWFAKILKLYDAIKQSGIPKVYNFFLKSKY